MDTTITAEAHKGERERAVRGIRCTFLAPSALLSYGGAGLVIQGGLAEVSASVNAKCVEMVRLRAWLVAVVVSATLLVAASDAWAEHRVALVVGNSHYAGASLLNPRNDAQDVAAELETFGFEVQSVVIDAGKREMEIALQRFAQRATTADTALFFYAGHAMQYQGRNYLMPIDAEVEDEFSVRYQMIDLEEVRAALERANGVKIMILDACRNNPFAARLQASNRSVATTRGLARIDKTQGMVIAYATAPDDVADDGKGRNSPFTTALLKWLKEPLEIGTMLRRVASDVNTQTNGRQRPETSISLLSDFYLNQNDLADISAWGNVNKEDVASLRDFVNRYPSSPYGILARSRIELLERPAEERIGEQKRVEDEKQHIAGQNRAEEEKQRIAEQKRAEEEKDQICRSEQARLAELQAGGAARDQLVKFEIEATCKYVRQSISAAIASLPADPLTHLAKTDPRLTEPPAAGTPTLRPAAVTNTGPSAQVPQVAIAQTPKAPALAGIPVLAAEKGSRPERNPQIALAAPESIPVGKKLGPTAPAENLIPREQELTKKVQFELKRLGCYDGKPDGNLNGATRNAVRKYWAKTQQHGGEVEVTDGLVAELERHDSSLCIEAQPPKPAPPVAERGRKDKSSQPPKVAHEHEHEPAPPRPQVARQSPAAVASKPPSATNHASGGHSVIMGVQ